MKLLKKQRGLPFLLALGVLFILSASFLAVQLWSEKTFRGALFALEAPVMPPAMPKVAPPAVKKVARKPAIVVEAVDESEKAPEVQAEPVPAPELKEVTSINKAEVKSEPVEKPAAGVEKSVKPVVVEEKIAPPVAKSQHIVEDKTPGAAKPSVKSESSVVKPRKTRKKAKVEEIPTEVPAEWNWFSKPLKVDLAKGKAVIELDEAGQEIRLSVNEKIKGDAVSEKVEVTVEVPSEVHAATVEEVDVSVVAAEPATGKPFMVALARMARIKQMRHAADEESREIAVKKSEPVSPSMRRLTEVIKVLCDKLDSRPEARAVLEDKAVTDESQDSAGSAVPEIISETETPASSKVSDNASFKPYYGGSGTSFSQRVNSLIKSGMIRAE